MSYKHLSLAERHYIQIERKLGKSCKQIACDLGRSASTISREISRNTGLRGYRHQQADRLARQRLVVLTVASRLITYREGVILYSELGTC